MSRPTGTLVTIGSNMFLINREDLENLGHFLNTVARGVHVEHAWGTAAENGKYEYKACLGMPKIEAGMIEISKVDFREVNEANGIKQPTLEVEPKKELVS